jgi:hypothetical protein
MMEHRRNNYGHERSQPDRQRNCYPRPHGAYDGKTPSEALPEKLSP